MKFSVLGFNQEKVLGLRKKVTAGYKTKEIAIDVVDLMILREVADFMNRKNIIKYFINDKVYYFVKYSVIIEDLPILNIKQQALTDRLNKLCEFDLLEKEVVKNQAGSFTAFRTGDNYERILYSEKPARTSSQLLSHLYSTTSANVADYQCEYNLINSNNSTSNKSTKTKKEKKENIIKEKKEQGYKRFVKPTVDDIKRYVEEKGYHIDANAFFDFYESKGWVVGKSPMKDWHAACRTWERKHKERNANTKYMKLDAEALEEIKTFTKQQKEKGEMTVW